LDFAGYHVLTSVLAIRRRVPDPADSGLLPGGARASSSLSNESRTPSYDDAVDTIGAAAPETAGEFPEQFGGFDSVF